MSRGASHIHALLALALLVAGASLAAATPGLSVVAFRGEPLTVRLEPGRLTEVAFPRAVIDVASGDEVLVVHREGDSILYLRAAKPRFETSIFVRLDGGYSIPLVIERSSSAHPTTISMRVSIDPSVRASRELMSAHLEGRGPAGKGRSPAFSETDLVRAIYRGEKLAGYSILEENGRLELETPEVSVRRIRTWLSPVWEGLLVEISNRTDQVLELEPLSFQGQGPQAPRMLYLYDQRLAPRPDRASELAVSAHKTHAILVRPSPKAGPVTRTPRAAGGGS